MDKSNAAVWRELFGTWPANFRRKGVALPTVGEGIPFVDFVMSMDMIILERATPDNVGARRVAIPFESIVGLKYTEPLKTEQYEEEGFVKSIDATVLRAMANATAGMVPATQQQYAPAGDPYHDVLQHAQAVQAEIDAAIQPAATDAVVEPEPEELDPFANDIPYKAKAQPYAAGSLQMPQRVGAEEEDEQKE